MRVVDWQGNEVSVNWRGQSLRLDRLMHRANTDEGEGGVTDYQSALRPQSQAELLAQLADSRQAVHRSYPDAVVRVAFLTAAGALVELPSSLNTNA